MPVMLVLFGAFSKEKLASNNMIQNTRRKSIESVDFIFIENITTEALTFPNK